jgi:hypothetical protein
VYHSNGCSGNGGTEDGSAGGEINIGSGTSLATNGSGGTINVIGGKNKGTCTGGAINVIGGQSLGSGLGGAVIVSGGLGATIGGTAVIKGGDGNETFGGKILLSGGTADGVQGIITFSSAGSSDIPLNTIVVPNLNAALPQNIIGAINALSGRLGPAIQRVVYPLSSSVFSVNKTDNIIIAYFSWIGSRYGNTTGLGYRNGALNYEWNNINAGTLTVDIYINNSLSNTQTETGASGFRSLSITNGNLPGDNNQRIDIRVRRSVAGSTNPDIRGIVLEFDTSS